MNRHIHVDPHTKSHAYIPKYTHTNKHTHTGTHAVKYKHTECRQTHGHTCTFTHMDKCEQLHIHTHAHRQTFTHIYKSNKVFKISKLKLSFILSYNLRPLTPWISESVAQWEDHMSQKTLLICAFQEADWENLSLEWIP